MYQAVSSLGVSPASNPRQLQIRHFRELHTSVVARPRAQVSSTRVVHGSFSSSERRSSGSAPRAGRRTYRPSTLRVRSQSEDTVENASTPARESQSVAGVLGQNTTYAYDDLAWEWETHKINYVVSGSGPPLVLIHGFGANLRHYRQTIPALAETNTVYAIDLLGFGRSDKPIGFEFSTERWRDLVLDFLVEVVQQPAVLVGNSIGSLISLMAAAESPARAEDLVRGIVLLNCAGGMNSKFVMESPLEDDEVKYKLFSPLFWLIDRILRTRAIAEPIFNNVKTPANIRQVLGNVYVNGEAVDDELVDMFAQPALDAGAFETFIAILTGAPGPRPELVAQDVKCRMCIIWGTADSVTDLEGPIGKFFRKLSDSSGPEVAMTLVDTDHCPHDDDPSTVNAIIRQFSTDCP